MRKVGLDLIVLIFIANFPRFSTFYMSMKWNMNVFKTLQNTNIFPPKP